MPESETLKCAATAPTQQSSISCLLLSVPSLVIKAATASAQQSGISNLLLLMSSSVVKAAVAHAQQDDQQMPESNTLRRAATAPAHESDQQPAAFSQFPALWSKLPQHMHSRTISSCVSHNI